MASGETLNYERGEEILKLAHRLDCLDVLIGSTFETLSIKAGDATVVLNIDQDKLILESTLAVLHDLAVDTEKILIKKLEAWLEKLKQ